MRKEERLIVEVPEWAMKSDEEFMKFWDGLMGKDGKEITDWLNAEKTVVFHPENSEEDE